MNEDNVKYSIITSFKKWYGISEWIMYWSIRLKYFAKLNIYKLINPKRTDKYRIGLDALKSEVRFEQVNSRKVPIIGHRQLELSLVRGFDDLHVPFKFDELSENIIVLWADKIDLRVIRRLRKQRKIKHVVTVPTACKYDYKDLMWNFPKYECIDYSLVASDNVKVKNEKLITSQYHKKIKSWASGVELGKVDLSAKPNWSCICYYKRLPVDRELTKFIESSGIKCHIIEYTKYKFEDWLQLLPKVDFVIFYQDYIETQGLAMAEAWAHNKPTLIKAGRSPYLTDDTGLFWNTTDELKKFISEYKDNPEKFLSQFSPYKWVENNMSDKISVQNLIKIFENI